MLTEAEYAQQLRKWRPRRDPEAEDPIMRPSVTNSPRPLPSALEARLRELWSAGITIVEIAEEIGRNVSTVSKWCHRLGLPERHLPPPTEWPPEDDAFVLRWYATKSKPWIARNLPSGRKVTRHAVIGRHHRLRHKKITQQARGQQEDTRAPV